MQSNIQISIIIPCFNRLALLKETLAAVLAQDSANWELILVDDGSEKDTSSYLKELAKTHYSVQFIERDRAPKGAPTCRNIGALHAKANHIIFLDSDDLIQANFVSLRNSYIDKYPDMDFIVFPTALFKKNLNDAQFLWNTIHKEKDDLVRFFDDDTPWHTSGPVWNKEAFLNMGGFNEQVYSGQDWEVHVKALIKGLTYVKAPENEDTITHFMRDDNHESITSGFLTTNKLQNRYAMYHEILKLLAQNKRLAEQLEVNVIKYFYRSAAMGFGLGINNAAKKHILALNEYRFCSIFLCKLLILRLQCKTSKLICKTIDAVLFRRYGISNIDFPVDRTKGLISYKSPKTERC